MGPLLPVALVMCAAMCVGGVAMIAVGLRRLGALPTRNRVEDEGGAIGSDSAATNRQVH